MIQCQLANGWQGCTSASCAHFKTRYESVSWIRTASQKNLLHIARTIAQQNRVSVWSNLKRNTTTTTTAISPALSACVLFLFSNSHQNHIEFRVRQHVFIAQPIAHQIRHVQSFVGQKDQDRRHVPVEIVASVQFEYLRKDIQKSNLIPFQAMNHMHRSRPTYLHQYFLVVPQEVQIIHIE